LIKLKKTNPAFVHGDNIMLDTDNTKVLSWLRVVKAQGPVGHAVVVATNFTAEPQQVRLNLFDAGVKTKRLKTLLETPQKSSQPPMAYVETDSSGRIENFAREFMISLPPFGVYIGEVE
jgi:hypothetical protein